MPVLPREFESMICRTVSWPYREEYLRSYDNFPHRAGVQHLLMKNVEARNIPSCPTSQWPSAVSSC